MPLLNCQNVALAYENRTVAQEVSFAVNRGDYLCVVGENGSGKSTLIKALLGLKKPIRGEIVLGDGLKRTEIGYLPQQSQAQRDFPASVREVVLSGCLNGCGARPFFDREQRERAQAAMERLGVASFKRRSYRELSGGQQQRVLLARALCATRTLLLLDEPVAGLDPLVTQELYERIAELHAGGVTVVMVSHDVGAALRDATHILHLQNRPLFFGTAQDYPNSDAGRRFLGGREHD